MITAASGAVAAVSGVASGQTAAEGPATKTVTYGTFRFQVPSAWPVYDLERDPGRCVRFDIHAVYLGHPGPDQACPARVRGRTDAVLIEPLKTANDSAAPAVHHLSAPDPDMAVPESVSRQQQVAIRGADVLMTVTYGDQQTEAQRVVRSGRVAAAPTRSAPAARPAPPAGPSPSPGSPSGTPPAGDSGSASPGPAAAGGPAADRHVAAAPPMSLAARRAPLMARAPVPRPAPAPAPAAAQEAPAAKPVPTVTVTKTVTVTPRAPAPAAPPARHVAQAQAAPHDPEPPLPEPGVSYSPAPDASRSAKPETKKAKDKKKKLPAVRAARMTGKGFDACTAPSLKAMRAWRKSFQAANIYIGGAARACGDGNLSKSWVKSVRKSGWKLIPTYVGLQAPCSPYGSKINTKKARAQGMQSADDAISEAKAFGLSTKAPLYFDMEGYNNTKSWCKQGVLKFLGGWTDRLHARGHISGVYGSVTSTIVDLGHASGGRMPDGVWFAHWDGKANTLSKYMNGAWWPNRQRIKQYRGTHNETHGGVKLSIDSNRVDGYVY
jgi:hypothetical protein